MPAIPLIIGIADFTWQAGDLTFTGIALRSIATLVVYRGMRLLSRRNPAVRQLAWPELWAAARRRCASSYRLRAMSVAGFSGGIWCGFPKSSTATMVK